MTDEARAVTPEAQQLDRLLEVRALDRKLDRIDLELWDMAVDRAYRLRRLGIQCEIPPPPPPMAGKRPSPARVAELPKSDSALRKPTIARSFRLDETEIAGRTIEAMCVPYNVVARVADPPTYTPYQERFVMGAFARQAGTKDRAPVLLNFEHGTGIAAIIGHDLELREARDGLHARFVLHRNNDGDKGLQLAREGILRGLSLEFAALKSRTVDGVVERLSAHLDKVALCRQPAYADAQVLAVRQEEAPLG